MEPFTIALIGGGILAATKLFKAGKTAVTAKSLLIDIGGVQLTAVKATNFSGIVDVIIRNPKSTPVQIQQIFLDVTVGESKIAEINQLNAQAQTIAANSQSTIKIPFTAKNLSVLKTLFSTFGTNPPKGVTINGNVTIDNISIPLTEYTYQYDFSKLAQSTTDVKKAAKDVLASTTEARLNRAKKLIVEQGYKLPFTVYTGTNFLGITTYYLIVNTTRQIGPSSYPYQIAFKVNLVGGIDKLTDSDWAKEKTGLVMGKLLN